MLLSSLRESFGLLRKFPVLMLNGIIWGLFVAISIILSFSPDSFVIERIGILMIIILPFFVAAAFGVIKEQNGRISAFVSFGFKYYFYVLLPTVIIFFAWILTMFMLSISLVLLGVSQDTVILSMTTLGALVPIVFFTFFYDAAAILEERKIFDSIRRSIELVVLNPVRTLIFFATLLGIFIVLYVAVNAAWYVILPSQTESLLMFNQSEIMAFGINEWKEILGEAGIVWTAAIIMGAVAIFINILYPFKAVFFMKQQKITLSSPVTGEYDEKGRWYKY